MENITITNKFHFIRYDTLLWNKINPTYTSIYVSIMSYQDQDIHSVFTHGLI